MTKELSHLQARRQRGRVRRQAEREMAKPREPRNGRVVAQRLGKEKDDLQNRDRAAAEFRRM